VKAKCVVTRRALRAPRVRRMHCQECQRSVVPVMRTIRDYEDYQGSPWVVGFHSVMYCPICGSLIDEPNRPETEMVEDIELF
jgi:hypothetical protein